MRRNTKTMYEWRKAYRDKEELNKVWQSLRRYLQRRA